MTKHKIKKIKNVSLPSTLASMEIEKMQCDRDDAYDAQTYAVVFRIRYQKYHKMR